MADKQLVEVPNAVVVEFYDEHYGWQKAEKISFIKRVVHFIKSIF